MKCYKYINNKIKMPLTTMPSKYFNPLYSDKLANEVQTIT